MSSGCVPRVGTHMPIDGLVRTFSTPSRHPWLAGRRAVALGFGTASGQLARLGAAGRRATTAGRRSRRRVLPNVMPILRADDARLVRAATTRIEGRRGALVRRALGRRGHDCGTHPWEHERGRGRCGRCV